MVINKYALKTGEKGIYGQHGKALKKEEEVDLTDYTSGGVVVANYIFNY